MSSSPLVAQERSANVEDDASRDPSKEPGGPTFALELSAVTRHRGSRRILGPIDLQVAHTETLAILGPNGAGKSTLLNTAATILQPSGGKITIGGHDPRSAPDAARRKISILTQQAPLYDELTPHEHIAWWGRMRGVRVADPASNLAEAGLTRLAHRPCGQLSRGERQRTALAMALIGEPSLLLLDEPFTALDEGGRAWLQGRLEIRRGVAATVIASHDAAHAQTLADRVLRLEEGRWLA